MIKFLGSFEQVSKLPNLQFPEFAFVGRSNVGKSSLINAVAGSKIARTSNTPGRTQSLNLFNFHDKITIVDLPGYGYARVSKTEQIRWSERLGEYLLNRRQLTRLFILIDSRIGLKDSDTEVMHFCDANGISYQIIMTKKDKKQREINQAKITTDGHPAMMEKIIETSAERGYGIAELRDAIGIE
jgi:GTP-binding protein